MLYNLESVVGRKIEKTVGWREKQTSVLLLWFFVFLACCGCCLGPMFTARALDIGRCVMCTRVGSKEET
jgi:hypothetical protein